MIETIKFYRCIKDASLTCDKNMDCLQCINDEKKIYEKWINKSIKDKSIDPEIKLT